MRELKFRAWDKEDKVMYHSPDMYDWDGFLPFITIDCEDNDWCNNIILMQYTDLKDKNGKEIYEGDIVRVKEMDFDDLSIHKVEWDVFGFSPWVIPDAHIDGTFDYSCLPENNEVIGNVFENPELLREENV